MYALLVTLHITGAIGGLITGTLAFVYPNGTPKHRIIGKTYLAMWVLIAVTGFIFGMEDLRPSPFEIATAFSIFCVVKAYMAIVRRKKLGRIWLKQHYGWMLGSMAGLVIATVNQVLPRLGITYPIWVFIAMAVSPAFILPLIQRRLDRRYGFAKEAAPQMVEGGTVA